ncbi:MAG: NADH-quinone oxidoreductase subunit J [Alphaproteobacteria bacterium]
MLADLLFIFFAFILVVAALGVITAKNPMYCVLFMVLAFLNAAGIFLLLQAEFLGLLLVMVYVGAIAIMFLFVLMTVDIDFAQLKSGYATYLPMGLLVAALLAVELMAAGFGGIFTTAMPPLAGVEQPDNIRQLGRVLFTDYVLPFQGAAFILLVAMIGAIVLTHRKRGNVKRQNVASQIARTKDESMLLTKPKSGEGVTRVHFAPKIVEEN